MRLAVLCVLLAIPVTAADARSSQRRSLRVHEWGVWKVRQGRIEHLADLRRECPPFVRQAVGMAVAPGSTLSRKPVVYVYANRPMHVDVDVRFPGGRAWLFFPGAEATSDRVARDRGPMDPDVAGTRRAAPFIAPPNRLHWSALVEPNGDSRSLPAVPRGHFWNHLRAVPASTLTAADDTREKFLFYDGPVDFRQAYRTHREGDVVEMERFSAAGASDVLIAKDDQWVAVSDMVPGTAARIRTAHDWPRPPRSLREELSSRLQAAGLSDAETRALVDTWTPEIEDPALRAFWLLPRAEYDRMLPIEITPTPRELVRVGLVIERLD